MSKRLTVLPDGTQEVRDLTAAELAERAKWIEADRPARELPEKQARFSALRTEILNAQAAAETPDPGKIAEFKTLKTELGR